MNFSLVFSDFDGTLTLKHSFCREFFDIIELLEANGIPLVIVTGRSLSWGHFLLTHFPLKSLIVEGGGILLTKDEKGIISEEVFITEDKLAQLDKGLKNFHKAFPGINLSADSFGRKTDRAIELFDLDHKKTLMKEITDFFDSEEINYSSSNVHLNFWAGEISKQKASLYYLNKYHQDLKEDDCLFFGDSLNDEGMFQAFSRSIGVSNIKDYLPRLKYRPQIILEGNENRGPLGVLNFLNDQI